MIATQKMQGIRARVPEAVSPLRRWCVLRTRSRQEKAIAELLSARGVEHFLPLVRKVRYYGRRKQAVSLPLFPGYLFLRGHLEEVYEADRTERVVQILDVHDQPALESDLAAIRFVLDRNGGLEPTPFLERGTLVEVTSGPMRGLRGLIDRTSAADRLVLGVRMLGRAAELEIDRSLLRTVG